MEEAVTPYGEKLEIRRPLWAAAPVQLCMNIHMDEINIILFGISQLSNYFVGTHTIAKCE